MHHPLVLVADDHEETRFVVAAILSGSGYEVVGAPDGIAAVELCLERNPDLVLMDLGMPLMNGWDATCALRADPSHTGTPVVAITGHEHAADPTKLRTAGFDDFLRKPFTPAAMLDAVRRCLSSGGGAARVLG